MSEYKKSLMIALDTQAGMANQFTSLVASEQWYRYKAFGAFEVKKKKALLATNSFSEGVKDNTVLEQK